MGEVKFTTVLGGHPVSGEPEIVMRNHSQEIDCIVVGEDETGLAEFLRRVPHVCSMPIGEGASPAGLEFEDFEAVAVDLEFFDRTHSEARDGGGESAL